MTPYPECVTTDTPIVDALHTMHDGRFLHLPVVDRDGNFVCVIDVTHITHAAISTVGRGISTFRRNETSRISNTHQVIGSMIKGDYDDDSNWQMVEYILDRYNSEGCGFGLRLYNAILDSLWWLGQKARAARLLVEATRRSLFPELFRQSKLIWSVDVHRMSVGGALTAISMRLNETRDRFQRGEDLPTLAAVVVVRGEMEKSSSARNLPLVKAAYSFLRDEISPSFHFPGWNKGRIVCHRAQLKRLLSTTPNKPSDKTKKGFVQISNSSLPLPGTRIHTSEIVSDELSTNEEVTDSETEAELMALAL